MLVPSDGKGCFRDIGNARQKIAELPVKFGDLLIKLTDSITDGADLPLPLGGVLARFAELANFCGSLIPLRL